jgi:hypothetical protein
MHLLVVTFRRLNAGRDVAAALHERINRYVASRFAHLDDDFKRVEGGGTAAASIMAGGRGSGGGGSGGGGGGISAAIAFLRGQSRTDRQNELLAAASMGSARVASGTFSPLASGIRYRRGQHPILRVGPVVREMCREASDAVDALVLQAFRDDDAAAHAQAQTRAQRQQLKEQGPAFSWRGDAAVEELYDDARFLPAEIVLSVTDLLFDRCAESLRAAAQSPVVSIHDCVFIGLDLLNEMWQWRFVARRAAGDTAGLSASVDEQVDLLIGSVTRLLNDYQYAKGMLGADELVEVVADPDVKVTEEFLMLIGVHSRRDDDDDGDGDESDDGDDEARRRRSRLPKALRCSWLPRHDCAVHHATAGIVQFFKQLLSGDFEALLFLTLYGSTSQADASFAKQKAARKRRAQREAADDGRPGGALIGRSAAAPTPSARLAHSDDQQRVGGGSDAGSDAGHGDEEVDVEDEAFIAAEQFFESCMDGHLMDLEAISDAGVTILCQSAESMEAAEAEAEKSRKKKGGRRRRADDDSDEGGGAGAAARPVGHYDFNKALFMINNMQYVVAALTTEQPFTASLRNENIATTIADKYGDRLEAAVDFYTDHWVALLPPIDADRAIAAIAASRAEELSKGERQACKMWFQQLCGAVDRECDRQGVRHVVDAQLRQTLARGVAAAVAAHVRAMDQRVVRLRRWSDRPEKYRTMTAPELTDRITAAFGRQR